MKSELSFQSIFFATFSRYVGGKRFPTNGMVEPILWYFLPRVTSLLMLDTPHVVSDTIDPIIEVYKNARLQKKYTLSRFLYWPIYLWCKLPSKSNTRISYKLRDFFAVLYVAIARRERYDLFIGLESINALAGLILKKLGIVKTVVYYVSDYAPVRFPNKIFNAVYLWLDRICVTYADFTWDVSPAMQKARITAGLSDKATYRVIHVPNGLFAAQIAPLPIKKRAPHHMVYMGILESDMGPDLPIRALPYVHRTYPDAFLHIIGGPEKDMIPLEALVKRMHLDAHVRFYGFVKGNKEMADIVRHCAIGLAPYRAFKDSLRWYGDAGKIRQYTASGLPVVTTNVPPLGHYIVSKGAGIMTTDTAKSFSDGILMLLSDKALYKKLSQKAIEVSKDNTWEKVYSKALADMKRIQESL